MFREAGMSQIGENDIYISTFEIWIAFVLMQTNDVIISPCAVTADMMLHFSEDAFYCEQHRLRKG